MISGGFDEAFTKPDDDSGRGTYLNYVPVLTTSASGHKIEIWTLPHWTPQIETFLANEEELNTNDSSALIMTSILLGEN